MPVKDTLIGPIFSLTVALHFLVGKPFDRFAARNALLERAHIVQRLVDDGHSRFDAL
jgi:hypothetical protein